MAGSTYRTALVTGASSGIGAALARRLAAEGTEVILCARRELELQAQVAAISEAGGRAHAVVLDLKDPRQTEQIIKELDERFQLDLCIANAGVGRFVPARKLAWDQCEEMIDVNVAGSVATLVAVLPGMLERNRGHLVGTSSIAQGLGMPGNGTYLASKAFLSTFLASLRAELHDTGVDVTDVRPGIVDTPMSESLTHRPFVIGADEAATMIVDGMRRREAVLAFPRSARVMFAGFRVMPDRVFSSVMRRMSRD